MSIIYKRLERCAGPDSYILDVGTGDGAFLQDIAGEIVGIDLHADCENESITYARADAANLPFTSNQFDYVISNQVIEHIPHEKKPGYVNEMARVLKPDGECLIAFPSRLYPIPPHLMPPFFTWLPRPVGLWIAKYVLSDRRYEFYRDSAFNLSPITARRLFTRAFGEVSYETIKLVRAHGTKLDGWQTVSSLVVNVESVFSIPGVSYLFELLFGYASYRCTEPRRAAGG